MKVCRVVAWYDLWIGAYWDRRKRRLYVLPLPMIGFYVQFEPHPEGDVLWCRWFGHSWEFVGYEEARRAGDFLIKSKCLRCGMTSRSSLAKGAVE